MSKRIKNRKTASTTGRRNGGHSRSLSLAARRAVDDLVDAISTMHQGFHEYEDALATLPRAAFNLVQQGHASIVNVESILKAVQASLPSEAAQKAA